MIPMILKKKTYLKSLRDNPDRFNSEHIASNLEDVIYVVNLIWVS